MDITIDSAPLEVDIDIPDEYEDGYAHSGSTIDIRICDGIECHNLPLIDLCKEAISQECANKHESKEILIEWLESVIKELKE